MNWHITAWSLVQFGIVIGLALFIGAMAVLVVAALLADSSVEDTIDRG